jgi:hypothetical protein
MLQHVLSQKIVAFKQVTRYLHSSVESQSSSPTAEYAVAQEASLTSCKVSRDLYLRELCRKMLLCAYRWPSAKQQHRPCECLMQPMRSL